MTVGACAAPAEGLEPGWMVPPRTNDLPSGLSGSELKDAANSSYSFAASSSARCTGVLRDQRQPWLALEDELHLVRLQKHGMHSAE